MTVELAIRGGTIVTEGGRVVGDVGIAGGRIVQVGGRVRADREIDARGRLVIPGGVDPHVHLVSSLPQGTGAAHADDIGSGTRAAAMGGITTVGNMAYPLAGETPLVTVERSVALAESGAVVDFLMHPVIPDPSPEVLAELPALAAAGHTSIKVFMVSPAFDARIDEFVALIAAAGRSGILTIAHCEDGPIVRQRTAEILRSGGGGVGDYAAARPAYAEAVAVARLAAIGEATTAPVYVAHVASRDAVAAAKAARGRGVEVHLETRPIYLLFTSERFAGDDGALYVGNPPLREAEDVEALWAGLAAGVIDTVASDHAPWSRGEKLAPDRNISNLRPGMPDLETMLPLLYSEGVRTGRLSIERFVAVTSTNAARLFGLYPTKGTIRVGSDADLVVWDPERTRTVTAVGGQSRAGFSLYEGWDVTGWPAWTLSRGRVIVADGELVQGAGGGRAAIRRAGMRGGAGPAP